LRLQICAPSGGISQPRGNSVNHTLRARMNAHLNAGEPPIAVDRDSTLPVYVSDPARSDAMGRPDALDAVMIEPSTTPAPPLPMLLPP
jgi:hypothetical protein